MSDFDGLPLVVGSVTGVRAWDVDELGRLRGITHTHIWTPGENVAYHSGSGGEAVHRMSLRMTASIYGRPMPVGAPPKVRDDLPADHSPATCLSCGFYAYNHQQSDRLLTTQVHGVIEGYGKVAVGTKGFRAEKAKIVALVAPTSKRMSKVQWRIDKLARHLSNPDQSDWAFPLGLASFMAGLGSSGICAIDTPLAIAFGIVVALTCLLGGVYLFSQSLRSIGYHRTHKSPFIKTPADRIRENYPDVQFFPTLAAMLRAFPPDPTDEWTPDTDPDFWTRGI